MPLIKSAKKKLRQDKKRTARNLAYEEVFKKGLKKITSKADKKSLSAMYSKIDRAVKKNVIHKNKGNRLKSRISKSLKSK